MLGQTISYYRIVEKLGGAPWVWSTKPKIVKLGRFCFTNERSN
jgi:hypothetical protein